MSESPVTHDPWPRRATLVVAAMFVASAAAGLILLPQISASQGYAGLWDAICSAAGAFRAPPGAAPEASTQKHSNVFLRSDFLHAPDASAIGHGATLAQRCAICHGPTGESRADAPNLAGQYPGAVYKELVDFKDGVRANAVMAPFAYALSDEDMRDIAAYYAYLPRMPAPPSFRSAPSIVAEGAPLRNIPPCGACHGALEAKIASPWLGDQPAAYVKAQLLAFASGARHNDIEQQMRNIARNMTPQEIEEAAAFYSSTAGR